MLIDERIYRERPFTLEPPDGLCLSGAGQSIESIYAMQNSMPEDKKPVLIALYEALNGNGYTYSPNIVEAHNLFPGAVLQIGFQLPCLNNEELRKIADGDLDDQIEILAHNYRSIRLPVILRIGYEPDGEWNGYDPELYIKAYNRIAARIKGAGAYNVQFFLNTYIPHNKDFFKWYPNDEYVDWLGYNTMQPKFDAGWFCEEAQKRGKPLMIGESSYAILLKENPHMSFGEWLNAFFTSMEVFRIKGFQYINWKWEIYPSFVNWKGWQDGRYTEETSLIDQYNACLTDWLIYRGSNFYQPLRLFVHCARNITEQQGVSEKWERGYDHATSSEGWHYALSGIDLIYSDGFTCHCCSKGNAVKLDIAAPCPVKGYFMMDFHDVEGQLEQGIPVSVTLNGNRHQMSWSKGGYLKVPFYPENMQKATLSILVESAKKVRICQFGILEISELAPKAPCSLTIKRDIKECIQLLWEETGAYLYNIYKNGQLLDMTEESTYTLKNVHSGDSFSVSSYSYLQGEGEMSPLLLIP